MGDLSKLREELLKAYKETWSQVMQLLCVLYCLLGLVVSSFTMPFIFPYLLLFTSWRYACLLYICWMIYDWKTPFTGGRSTKWLLGRKIGAQFFRGFLDYFPATLVKTADLPPGNNYLVCMFPHGILTMGTLANFALDINCREKYPELESRVITLNSMFYTPLTREFVLMHGCCASDKESILTLLKSEERNKVVVLVVGGTMEAVMNEPGENKIVINERKGFVKLALKSGSPLVPAYTFGETSVYDHLKAPWLQKVQNMIHRLTGGPPPLVVLGRDILPGIPGLFPHPTPLVTVVGAPIDVPKIENPSAEEVNKYHLLFKASLLQLFDRYKGRYDPNGEKAKLLMY